MRRALKVVRSAVAAAAGIYGGYVAATYLRFRRESDRTGNPLLGRLMPEYEVREHHAVTVSASADITLAAAREISFHDSLVIRTLFALRGLPARVLGASPAPTVRRPVLDEVIALGWHQLAEIPGRQVIMGAVTQPWRQEVHFHGLPAEEFVAFREPGYVKIAWTIEVEPAGTSASVFSTGTRVLTADPASRERFRRYWTLLSPGILMIRYEMLRLVRAEAERRCVAMSRSSRAPAIRPPP